MQRAFAYLNDRSGGVAVEGAIIFPMLILLGFGGIDASLLMAQNHRMEAGLMSAGNYLARAERPSQVEAQARRLAVTGQLNNSGAPLVPGWETNDVIINYRNIANPELGGQRQYRGGNTIQVVSISSEHAFGGLGFIKTVSGGKAVIRAAHEERRMGSQRLAAQ